MPRLFLQNKVYPFGATYHSSTMATFLPLQSNIFTNTQMLNKLFFPRHFQLAKGVSHTTSKT